jgi:hypothetical protein
LQEEPQFAVLPGGLVAVLVTIVAMGMVVLAPILLAWATVGRIRSEVRHHYVRYRLRRSIKRVKKQIKSKLGESGLDVKEASLIDLCDKTLEKI